MNPQVAYGDDVISRISQAREKPNALYEMQQAILGAMNDIVTQTVRQADISRGHVYELVVAGNSTMQQILCGFDPSSLGELPFVQVFDRPRTIPAATLGLNANPGAELFVFPQVGGFVGGDTVAGMLASRMDRWDKPVLLVDIGTNGEIVLAHNGQLLAASTAAGPAFEGARITQGMRATAGAIEKVLLQEDVLLNVIGNTKPCGICGTALIDAVAEMLRKGLIDETGRILSRDEVDQDVPQALLDRLITNEEGTTNFLLAASEDTSNGEAVYLWQKDIRELQLASGAIRAGILILVRQAGLEPGDIGTVLLAGAFGNFIRRNNARRIGLLPQVPCHSIRFIGNAASLGAKLALLSESERDYAGSMRSKIEHVDLSLDMMFQMEFAEAMIFPDHDLDACSD
jgi:uncharacterized 2Fe-2S/4Fe-4S cluster protein (DUF4445 family)